MVKLSSEVLSIHLGYDNVLSVKVKALDHSADINFV